MGIFRSRDKKWKERTVEDRKGNKFNIPVGEDGYVPEEALQKRFQSRYAGQIFPKGMIRDQQKQSSRVYPEKMTPEDALQYWKHTNRYDVEGVDAPPGTANYFPEKGKTKASKKKTPKQKSPAQPPYMPREKGSKESINNYETSLYQELIQYMGEDYVTIWGVDSLMTKYGWSSEEFASRYAKLNSSEFVRKERKQEYVNYYQANKDAVHRARVEKTNASKDQDAEIRRRVEERKANASRIAATPESADVRLKSINEDLARQAKHMNSYDDYKEGSATESYQEAVKRINEVALEHKRKIDPMYWPEVDRLVQTFANKYGDWVNRYNSVDTMMPSILVAGGSNFNNRKKEKQNEARSRLWKEYREIMAIEERIKSTGTGGIQSSDPNAVAKIEEKIVKLQDAHESKLRINKAIRGGEDSKAFKELSEDEQKETLLRIKMKKPIPGYELTSDTAEIKRLKGRLQDIQDEEEFRQNNSATYPVLEGIQVIEDTSDDKIRLVFDDVPNPESRTYLKKNGFKWSPRNKAWQRQLNANGRNAVMRALEQFKNGEW